MPNQGSLACCVLFGLCGSAAHGQVIVHYYTLVGDANYDGRVGLDDADALFAHYGASGAVWTEGDFNYDGVVNSADLQPLAANWGQVSPNAPAPPPSTSTFAIHFKGGSAPTTYTEVPISSGAIADDPTLAGAHCYRVGFNLPAGVDFTCAALDVKLASGSFYHPAPSGLLATNPATWNTPGQRQHAFDTFAAATNLNMADAAVLGRFPEAPGGVITTSDHFSVAWGDIITAATGPAYVAQLTVIGTTLTADSVLPEPALVAPALYAGFALSQGRVRRHRIWKQ